MIRAPVGEVKTMPRPIWTGTISFGLVSLPVKLYSATESQDIHFNQFERGTGERVRHKRVAEESGHEVAYDDIVKGYEVTSGSYVMVEKEELESVEPGRSKAIEIEDFIDLEEVDPVYFEKTYHLVPADEGAARPYALLVTTMSDAGRVGIARFVMRGKQHLATIRPQGDALVLETMFFPDEVRSSVALSELKAVKGVDLNDRELAAARQLVDSLTTEWDPSRYHDTYRERVLELLERKAEGEDIVTKTDDEPSGNVVDLMAALEASIERARGERTGKASADGEGKSSSSSSKSRSKSKTKTESSASLADMSREELYEEAQKRDIGGRSKMSKDELIDALQEAS
jgi:DNA end-binding protein Ku